MWTTIGFVYLYHIYQTLSLKPIQSPFVTMKPNEALTHHQLGSWILQCKSWNQTTGILSPPSFQIIYFGIIWHLSKFNFTGKNHSHSCEQDEIKPLSLKTPQVWNSWFWTVVQLHPVSTSTSLPPDMIHSPPTFRLNVTSFIHDSVCCLKFL